MAVQLEYQANVLIELLAVAMSLSGSLFLLLLFYGPDQTLGGWSWAQALMVQGLYTVFDGMATTWLRPNLGATVTHVREGTWDFMLLKPIDSQFWLSLRTLSPAGLPEIALGLGLLAWGSHQAGVVISLSGLFTVLVMLLAGGLILYSLWFLIAATSIWFVKTGNATEVLRALLASGRYPLNAYPLSASFALVVHPGAAGGVSHYGSGPGAAWRPAATLVLQVWGWRCCSLQRRGPFGSLPCATTPQHPVSAMLHAMRG